MWKQISSKIFIQNTQTHFNILIKMNKITPAILTDKSIPDYDLDVNPHLLKTHKDNQEYEQVQPPHNEIYKNYYKHCK